MCQRRMAHTGTRSGTGERHDEGRGLTGGPTPVTFEPFFRRHYAPLVRMLSIGADDPDDAVQEAFLQAYRRWDRISTYDDPLAWVRLVAVRRLQNRDRGRRRLATLIRGLPVSPHADLQAGGWGGRLELAEAVRSLPPRQRLAVALFYFHDNDLAEVGRLMGVTPGTVKASLHAARSTLRARMERDDD